MSKERRTLCDICEKPIKEHQGILFSHRLYSQYIVKIKSIEEGSSFAGSFRKKQILDVCPKCMDKFVEFAIEAWNRRDGAE